MVVIGAIRLDVCVVGVGAEVKAGLAQRLDIEFNGLNPTRNLYLQIYFSVKNALA